MQAQLHAALNISQFMMKLLNSSYLTCIKVAQLCFHPHSRCTVSNEAKICDDKNCVKNDLCMIKNDNKCDLTSWNHGC